MIRLDNVFLADDALPMTFDLQAPRLAEAFISCRLR